MNDAKCDMTLNHALQIRTAELWIVAGEPQQALAELNELPKNVRRDPWPARVLACALVAMNRGFVSCSK
jgi:hypothetical protein